MKSGLFEISLITVLFFLQLFDGKEKLNDNPKDFSVQMPLGSPQDRYDFERMKLADPATGFIPVDIAQQSQNFLNRIQNEGAVRSSSGIEWKRVGPYNVGGRTRALAVDISDENVLIAGSVSGGIWRSEDKGASWVRVSGLDLNPSISCITQDKRPGKQNIWYAGTGEGRGASQSGSGLSAYFGGNGVYKSTDNGKSWTALPSLINEFPQRIDSTDLIWKVLVTNQGSNDQLFIATTSALFKSEDGGASWSSVLSSSSSRARYIDIVQTSDGIFYAAVDAAGSVGKGIFRSTDGTNWVNITPAGFPTQYQRVVLASSPQNPNSFFLLALTPGSGKIGRDFRGNPEYHSLYKYTYLQGDGGGVNGSWDNLSSNLPVGPHPFDDYVSQGGYCMGLAVSPFDSNLVAIGGTNLYISTDGFKSDSNIRFAGGYGETTVLPDFQVYENHHPDIQTLLFSPFKSNELYSGSDGGVHLTTDCKANNVKWESLNNGYYTTQFYAMSMDPKTSSTKIMAGSQDNGTLLSIEHSPTSSWTLPWSYDGGYCSFSKNDSAIYTSKQLAGIMKIHLNEKGERTSYIRIDPVIADTQNYLFINPYMLDPNDNNRMYLLNGGKILRNDSLQAFTPDNSYLKQTVGWSLLYSNLSGTASCLDISNKPANTVYVGTTSSRVYKIVDADKANPTVTDISNGLNGSGYVSDIAIDPRNADKVIVVYSNYNTYSVFCTTDGGNNWIDISGNLEGKRPPGVPPSAGFANDGPSCRTGIIIPMENDSSLYMIGTSVGLFYTQTLEAENTYWSLMDPTELGNSIVTDLTYRPGDKMLGVATHGSGVFVGNLSTFGLVSADNSIEAVSKRIKVFPNPSNHVINIDVSQLEMAKTAVLTIYNSSGKKCLNSVDVKLIEQNENVKIDISSFSKGLYFVSLAQGGEILSSQFLVY